MLRSALDEPPLLRLDSNQSDIALPTEPRPKLRRSGAMTHKKMCELIQQGRGMGHGRFYLPWLMLRRKNPSPNSNQAVSWVPPLERTAHYFSRGEYHTALLLLWLGVKDLREQFPIWPIPHPHPLEGTPGVPPARARWSRGLLTLAREAGIEHGFEFGTRLPYVATLDLLATAPLPRGNVLAIFSSKPIEEPNTDIKLRTLERLELERRYSLDIGAKYFVSSSALIPLSIAGRLEWWLDASTLDCAPHLVQLRQQFVDYFNRELERPINETVQAVAKLISIEPDDAWLLFRHCAWTQAIDIDPSVPILTSRPPQPGGRAWRDSLRRSLFGETWS